VQGYILSAGEKPIDALDPGSNEQGKVKSKK